MTRTTLALAATCTALAFAAGSPVLAQKADGEVRTMRIEMADLNLASAEGRAALERRIQRAAKAVCAGDDSARYTASVEQIRNCRAQAEAKAFAVADALKPERLAAK